MARKEQIILYYIIYNLIVDEYVCPLSVTLMEATRLSCRNCVTPRQVDTINSAQSQKETAHSSTPSPSFPPKSDLRTRWGRRNFSAGLSSAEYVINLPPAMNKEVAALPLPFLFFFFFHFRFVRSMSLQIFQTSVSHPQAIATPLSVFQDLSVFLHT